MKLTVAEGRLLKRLLTRYIFRIAIPFKWHGALERKIADELARAKAEEAGVRMEHPDGVYFRCDEPG